MRVVYIAIGGVKVYSDDGGRSVAVGDPAAAGWPGANSQRWGVDGFPAPRVGEASLRDELTTWITDHRLTRQAVTDDGAAALGVRRMRSLFGNVAPGGTLPPAPAADVGEIGELFRRRP